MKKNGKYINCEACGKEIYRTNYELQQRNHYFCSRKCSSDWRVGRIAGENHPSWKGGLVKTNCTYCNNEIEVKPHRIKQAKIGVFCSQKCLGQWLSRNKSGKDAWLWQGGKNALQNTIRKSTKSKLWTRDVFERDNFTCVKCNEGSNRLNAHHIKRVSKIIKYNNIKTIKDAIGCDELWDLNNGVTLCYKCHREFHICYGNNKCTEEDYIEWMGFKIKRNILWAS